MKWNIRKIIIGSKDDLFIYDVKECVRINSSMPQATNPISDDQYHSITPHS